MTDELDEATLLAKLPALIAQACTAVAAADAELRSKLAERDRLLHAGARLGFSSRQLAAMAVDANGTPMLTHNRIAVIVTRMEQAAEEGGQ